MELLIKQRVFSWTDSYDVYDETGNARYFVKAEFFSFGHQIHIYDKRTGEKLGSVRQKLLTLMPTFDLVMGGRSVFFHGLTPMMSTTKPEMPDILSKRSFLASAIRFIFMISKPVRNWAASARSY